VQWRDKYRRLLAYVYVGDTMLNAELVRQGYAQVATFPPNVKYQELLLKLQREARQAKRGWWREKQPAGACTMGRPARRRFAAWHSTHVLSAVVQHEVLTLYARNEYNSLNKQAC
jgi:endonuclease YncB( thermonuclease family)